MVQLKRSLITVDAFFEAIDGYEHLDSDVLLDWLCEHFALDLDLVPEFRIALAEYQAILAAETPGALAA